MGAWGAGGFENDEALDFVSDVASADDLAAELGKRPQDPSQETPADQAQRMIAAAECVAAMLGRPAADLPKELKPRIAGFGEVGQELLDAAREGVSSVLSWSELPDLWAEEDATPFNLAIMSLIDRLNPDLPFNPPEPLEDSEVRQTCGFCDGEIEPAELVSINIDQQFDEINQLNRGFWCHLRCLNARLHPRHIVQDWKFDPEEIDRLADEIFKQD